MAVVHIATAAQNAALSAVTALIDAGAAAGTLKIYSGSMPADANTAASGTLLGTVTLGDPAVGSPTDGVGAVADPAEVNWSATGTAGWCRVADSDGNTVLDGDVGATGSGAFLELSSTSAVSGDPIDIAAGGTLTMPDGT